MVKLTKSDVKELVAFMEFFLDKESTIKIEDLMAKYGITFEEYRLLCDLSMPAIRRKNELANMKARATYYKTSRDKLKDKLDKIDDALGMAHQYLCVKDEENIITQEEAIEKAKNWLDEYFKPVDPPVVKRPGEDDEIVEAINKELEMELAGELTEAS